MSDAPLMLSVSGLRGLIGKSFTPPDAARYAASFGQWLKSQKDDGPPHVVVGRDSRPSGQMIELAAVSGLVSVGCKVTTVGIVTTPGVAIMTEHLNADGGMVITASHNPIIWNGIKALRHDGVAPSPDQAQQIVDGFKNNSAVHAAVEELIPVSHDESAHRVHLDRILPHVDVELIRNAKLKAVVDSVNGAGGAEAAMLLEALGVERVHIYEEPTGFFAHTPEPTKENLTELASVVAKHGADVGFAQDPDADRLALVDEHGAYIGEEYTLALAALHLFECKQGSALSAESAMVTCANLSTSRMIDDLAGAVGGRVIRTAVGEANVAGAMREHGALIGGEGNGGVIWPKVVHVRDSLVGMALVLELLAKRKQTLSDIVNTIPSYAIIKEKLPFDAELASQLETMMQQGFADAVIDLQDGVRVDWPDRWAHVRPSNTEPILRIIAEAPTQEEASALVQRVRVALGLAAVDA
jgi:phosphomannomutase